MSPHATAHAFTVGQSVRYRPGTGTYGYEESLEADGRLPGIVIGFTATRVKVRLTVNLGGCVRWKDRAVDAESLEQAGGQQGEAT